MRILAIIVAGLCLAGCGDADSEPICEGTTIACDQDGFYPFCSEPMPTDAVRDADGLFCINGDFDDFDAVYVGTPVEPAPNCSGGEVQACPGGDMPVCYYMPGCFGTEF